MKRLGTTAWMRDTAGPYVVNQTKEVRRSKGKELAY